MCSCHVTAPNPRNGRKGKGEWREHEDARTGEREGESARIPVARCLMRCGRGCSFLRPGVHPMPLLATPPYIMPRTSAATAGPATATSSGTCSLRVRLRAPGRSAAAASSSRLPRAMAATGADAAAAPPSLLVFSGDSPLLTSDVASGACARRNRWGYAVVFSARWRVALGDTRELVGIRRARTTAISRSPCHRCAVCLR